MTTSATTTPSVEPTGRSGRWVIWAAGLIVALGAAIATAHGLYEVAIAATVPGPIAWLYPLITDGLALVAYASTTRLTAGGRRYAWAVVVLAAGLSGLAQASYLAIGVRTTPAELRAGVGAWPAVAAAITAHLLYLLAARPDGVQSGGVQAGEVGQGDVVGQGLAGRLDGAAQPDAVQRDVGPATAVQPRTTVQLARHQPEPVGQPHDPEHPREVGQLSGPLPNAGTGMRDGDRTGPDGDLSRPSTTSSAPRSPSEALANPVQPDRAAQRRVGQPASQAPEVGQPEVGQPVQPDDVGQPDATRPVQPTPSPTGVVQPVGHPPVQPGGAVGQPPSDQGSEPPINRATAAAVAHRLRHGGLPSVSQLADTADVARGTAATALKRLRDSRDAERPGLHVVHDHPTGTGR